MLNEKELDRALIATMIGQDALVKLLLDKGITTDDELTNEVKKSKDRILKDLQAAGK